MISCFTRYTPFAVQKSSTKIIYTFNPKPHLSQAHLFLWKPVSKFSINQTRFYAKKYNMSDIELNCLVRGDIPASERTFPVEIAKSRTVGAFKKLIIQEKPNDFQHIDADKLNLWSVSIPLDVNADTALNLLVLEDDGAKGIRKLLPTKRLSTYFPDKLADDHIHIIVEPPIVSSKRDREQEPEVPKKAQKILGATSVSETRIFETIAENNEGRDKELTLPFSIPNFTNYRTKAGTIFADKTMYIEHLEKHQSEYRFMFLRPRRFGKSAFLDMLCQYYDIQKADIFNELFGPLYIGKNPTSSHNKHLVLKFDLSSISMSGSREEMTASFNDDINFVLKEFIGKYEKELGYPEVDNLINLTNASQSLKKVLSLAGKRNHTLFVGVDEYDAPANNSTFTGMAMTLNNDTLNKVSMIEQFFKDNFFAVLKSGCGGLTGNNAVISKYFLTGVLPAFRAGISPLAEAIIVSGLPALHGICGFTESEVKTIVQHYLGKNEQEADPLVHAMRKLYNGYYFAGSGYDESNPQPPLLYNPHLVFHYIQQFENLGFVAKPQESTSVHSTAVLKSIADVGEFSVHNLIELIVSGSVKSKIVAEFGFADLLNVGKDLTITFSLLYYLGILTRAPDGNLRIPNEIMKSDVLEQRVLHYLRAQDKIRTLIGPAFRGLVAGRIDGFVKLLTIFLETRAVRSLQTTNEAVLQGVVELLLDEPSNRVPELRLVLDGTKKKGLGHFGFVDIFIPPVADVTRERTYGVILELKDITLPGLWNGEMNEMKRPYGFSDLETLADKLCAEDEQRLLARKYMYWSKDQGRSVLTTVGAVMEGAVKQLERYMQTMALSKPTSYHDSGVLDNRIRMVEGHDNLQGYVIMAIGGRHVLVRSTILLSTSNEYQRALLL